MPYGVCPACQAECFHDVDDEPNLIATKNHHKIWTDYGDGEDWIEVWLCPECGQVFEEKNGYP